MASAEDIDLAMSHGLGRRYAFIGPFETAFLNGGPNGKIFLGEIFDYRSNKNIS